MVGGPKRCLVEEEMQLLEIDERFALNQLALLRRAFFSSNAKREAIFLWSQRREDVAPSVRQPRNCRPVSPAHDTARCDFLGSFVL